MSLSHSFQDFKVQNFKRECQAQFLNHALVILGNDVSFKDFQMILVRFFDISIAWDRNKLQSSSDKKFKIEKDVATSNFKLHPRKFEKICIS